MPTADVTVAYAAAVDTARWAALRDALWPDEADGHRNAITAFFAAGSADAATWLAFADGAAIGLAEASLRHDHVNGCETSPVAFLEGLYVDPAWRRRGVATQLVGTVAAWARARGVNELASDAPIDNVDSHNMHTALGFAETERVIFFRRSLA